MDKYKEHFWRNIRSKLEQWERAETITYEDVHRFFHNIAGTAAVIGMQDLGEKARRLLERLESEREQAWTPAALKEHVYELMHWYYDETYRDISPHFLLSNTVVEEAPLMLMIDDDPLFLMFMKEQMEKAGWQVATVAQPEKAVAQFYEVRPDCVVIDVHMNGTDGLTVLKELKGALGQQFVPTVIISGDHREEVRVQSYALGADDFMVKPFSVSEFLIRLHRLLERKKQLEEILLVDELTRLYNRKYLSEAYRQMENERERHGQPYCIALLDLDHFKQINDRYGHLVGDVVLREFALLLRDGTRPNDLAFRFGGEEFLLFLPKTQEQDAAEVIERLRSQFRSHPFSLGDEVFYCTFSCGIVEVNMGGMPIDEWLEQADAALYAAKNGGRDRTAVAGRTSGGQQRKTVKMAVVDDDVIVRTIVVDLLEHIARERKEQYEVQAFADGLSFVESSWHEDRSPCLVILDGVMPKMDGLEVLRRLRSRRDAARYRVIMLTMRQSEEDIARALQLGADDYITKPFKRLELEARVSRLLKRM
ncbi:diguanylate cyclase [Geobacillus thermocatenulatus]|uniref:diguanylate cyclase n=1 Tax=Geobacillus thermocatenulatus TaxID=33938 RepID=UPI00047399A7|nr:diguanylate cyclase [Geobacillus thermocatenulatus]KPD01049.1 Response regulator PleD [Geobacillus sp. BCO2]